MFMIIVNSILLIALVISYLVFSSIFVSFMFIVRFILTFNHNLSHKFTMQIKRLWLSFTVTTLSLYFVHPIYIYYNKNIFTKKKCLVISNHLTNYDWLFLLKILENLGMYEDIIIILKESLSNVPIFGYGMRVFGYIFLKREWSVDREILGNGLRTFNDKERFFLLLFPEGTLIDTETHQKSKTFCGNNQVKVRNEHFNPKHVLLPRKTGFEMIHSYLNTQIDGIVDMTLLMNPYKTYPSEEFTFYNVFIKRSRKMNMCCLINLIDLDSRKNDNWIYEIFEAKNRMVEKYVDYDKFRSQAEFTKIAEEIIKKGYGKNIDGFGFEKIHMWYKISPVYFIIHFSLFLCSVYFMGKVVRLW